jgi:hypothetical protein
VTNEAIGLHQLLAWHADEDELDYKVVLERWKKTDLDNKDPVIVLLSRSEPEGKWEKVT